MKNIDKNDLMLLIPLINDRESFNLDDFGLILARFGYDCFVVDGQMQKTRDSAEMKKLRETAKQAPQSQAVEILKAVYAYLNNVLEEWRRMPDNRRHEAGNIQVYNHTRTEIDALRELAYKYGVDLDEEVEADG